MTLIERVGAAKTKDELFNVFSSMRHPYMRSFLEKLNVMIEMRTLEMTVTSIVELYKDLKHEKDTEEDVLNRIFVSMANRQDFEIWDKFSKSDLPYYRQLSKMSAVQMMKHFFFDSPGSDSVYAKEREQHTASMRSFLLRNRIFVLTENSLMDMSRFCYQVRKKDLSYTTSPIWFPFDKFTITTRAKCMFGSGEKSGRDHSSGRDIAFTCEKINDTEVNIHALTVTASYIDQEFDHLGRVENPARLVAEAGGTTHRLTWNGAGYSIKCEGKVAYRGLAVDDRDQRRNRLFKSSFDRRTNIFATTMFWLFNHQIPKLKGDNVREIVADKTIKMAGMSADSWGNKQYFINDRYILIRKIGSRGDPAEGVPMQFPKEYHCRWPVTGHWRCVEGVGKDVLGNYCVEGKTWVKDCIKGPEDKPIVVRKALVA